MIDLDQLRPIAVGTSRLGTSEDSTTAVQIAIAAGVNTVDTSGSRPESFEVLNSLLTDNTRSPLFVLASTATAAADVAHDAVVGATTKDPTALEADSLARRIDELRNNLNGAVLDGFLIDEPEINLDLTTTTKDAYLEQWTVAIRFLEDQVTAGAIRHYGISSSRLAATEGEASNLEALVRIAGDVADTHSFRLIRTPFNLIEHQAVARSNGRPSLLERAGELGMVRFGTRPFEAQTHLGQLRIGGEDLRGSSTVDPGGEQATFDDCMVRIADQLQALDSGEAPMDVMVLQFLRDSRLDIGCPDRVERILATRFDPLIDEIYAGDVPPEDAEAFSRMRQNLVAVAANADATQSAELRTHLVATGALDPSDERPLELIAAERYLRAGIDHVVVPASHPRVFDHVRPLL